MNTVRMDTDGILKPVTLFRFLRMKRWWIYNGKHFELKVNPSLLLHWSSWLSWAFLCVFREAVSPSLCIRPSPWIPALQRISMKPCTHRQFHILSVTFVKVKDAKWTALHPTVSCHQGLATAEPGTVLCKTWPGRESQVLLVGRGEERQKLSGPHRLTAWAPWVLSALTRPHLFLPFSPPCCHLLFSLPPL